MSETKTKITYERQTRTVPTSSGLCDIPVMVGIGTGLGYNINAGEHYLGYTLTALHAGGYALINHPRTWDERVIQRWLEKVACLTDWTQNKVTFVGDLFEKYGDVYHIRREISELLGQAINEAAQEG